MWSVLAIAVVCLMLGVPVVQASDDVLTVGPDGEYDSIQSALDDADDGDTVLVGNGTYKERITITTPNVTVQSRHGPSETTIQKRGARLWEPVITIAKRNVTIRGLTITNSRTGLRVWDHGKTVSYQDLDQGREARIIGNRFTDLQIGLDIMSRKGRGGNLIKGNTFTDIGFNDISISGADNNRIVQNVITDYDANYALGLKDSRNNTVYLNAFVDNRINVYLDNSTNNVWRSPKDVYEYNGTQMTGRLGNYWSDYTGTDSDGDGIGEQSYGFEWNDRETDAPLISNMSEYRFDVETPQAETGANRTVTRGETIRLDASNSTDPDGEPLKYDWDLRDSPPQPNYSLDDMMTATPEAQFDTRGTYTLEATVTNPDGYSDTETVTVTVNAPPVAETGTNRTITVGETESLSSNNTSDPDGHALTHEWELTAKPDASSVSLTDASTVEPTLTPDVPGTYRAELNVTDEYGLSDTDTVTLITDGDPTAVAGPNRETVVGSPVTLDASNSTDPENKSLSYTWTFTEVPEEAGSPSLGEGVSTTLTPTTPGNYTIELTVTDPQNNTATDTVDVVANAPPTAVLDFSPDRPTVDEPIRFDATESTDVDGTIDTYHWDFGANGTIDATTETATINRTYHDTGDQLVRVTVADSDGLNDTTSAVVTVEARGPASPTSLRIDSPTNTSAVRVSEAGRRLTIETVVSYDRPLESVPSQVGDGFDVAIGQTTARASVQDVELTNSTAVTVTLVSAVEDVQPGWRDLHVTLRASPACQPNQACPTVIHTLDDTSPDAIAYKLDEVGNDPPTARLSFAPSNPTTGDWLVFSGFESSDPDGNITSYEWSFDGSESADTIWGVGSGWFTDHHFESAGDHTVSLTVTDDDGASNTISRTIPVVAGADESASVTIANLELQLRNITECGLTCRNVKYELKNPTSSPVSDLTADISINAGGETVLETEQAIGDVAAGETVTLTDRIEINQSQLTTILENDGKVTVEVQLRMGDATRTLTFDREL
jgi:nitrous oxidase accessory protein NosD